MDKERIHVGLVESVKINNSETVLAKIDTGASKSSIDETLAKRLGVFDVIKTKIVKNAHGKTERDVIELDVEIKGKVINAQFTLADRKDMKYSVLIGKNVLKKGEFLVDPLKV